MYPVSNSRPILRSSLQGLPAQSLSQTFDVQDARRERHGWLYACLRKRLGRQTLPTLSFQGGNCWYPVYISRCVLPLLILLLILISSQLFAKGHLDTSCCGGIGGIQYCDSVASRYVCRNGDYSTCYCNRRAVMDLNLLEGCCLWKGGVFKQDPSGLVICNNGGISDNCSLQKPVKAISEW